MPSAAPTGPELTAKIASCGVVDMTGAAFKSLTLDAKVRAAVREWETRTGFRPFVAKQDAQGAPVAETRLFDPPASRTLDLRAGLVRLDAVAVYDTAFVIGADVYPRPTNAPAEGQPYTSLHFLGRVAGRLPASIAVTGVWGHSLECEDDVREAILGWAAHLCVPEILLLISKGIYQMKDEETSISFLSSGGQNPLTVADALWDRNFRETAQGKKRVTL